MDPLIKLELLKLAQVAEQQPSGKPVPAADIVSRANVYAAFISG